MEARGAHNPEVGGSKPLAAIFGHPWKWRQAGRGIHLISRPLLFSQPADEEKAYAVWRVWYPIAMHLVRCMLPSSRVRLAQWGERSRAASLLLRRLCRPLSSEAEQSATTPTKPPSASAPETPLAETLKAELQEIGRAHV